jgi:uncharacterized membrane protein YcfT
MQLDRERVAWVDYAKGFGIVMVVMMHSTLGVEQAAGARSWSLWAPSSSPSRRRA